MVASSPSGSAPVQPSQKTATVLIVDDEDELRSLMGDVMRGEGYAVLEADSGRTALGLIEDGDPVDVAILDLRLGDMTGMDVAEVLIERFPATKLLFVTPSSSLVAQGLGDAGTAVVTKPFSSSDFARIVRELLGAA